MLQHVERLLVLEWYEWNWCPALIVTRMDIDTELKSRRANVRFPDRAGRMYGVCPHHTESWVCALLLAMRDRHPRPRLVYLEGSCLDCKRVDIDRAQKPLSQLQLSRL